MTYTPYQFANNASTTVAGGSGGIGTTLNPADTTLYLPTGQGAKFPASGYFMLQVGTTEYVKVTLNSADTFTIVRAQEGTTAGTWPVGTTVQAIVSAQALNDGMTELATLDSAKANLSGAAFTGNISTTGTLGATGAATLSSTLAVSGASTLTGAVTAAAGITSYKGETLAGIGVPTIVAAVANQAVSVTTTVALASYTTPNDATVHLYRVTGYAIVNNSVSGNNLTFQWVYTDGTGVSRTDSATAYGGTTQWAGANSVSNNRYPLYSAIFNANPNTTITVNYRDPTNTPNDHIGMMLERIV